MVRGQGRGAKGCEVTPPTNITITLSRKGCLILVILFWTNDVMTTHSVTGARLLQFHLAWCSKHLSSLAQLAAHSPRRSHSRSHRRPHHRVFGFLFPPASPQCYLAATENVSKVRWSTINVGLLSTLYCVLFSEMYLRNVLKFIYTITTLLIPIIIFLC